MSEPIRSLDARYYTDPEVFKLETSGLLARTWQFGCHASELAQIGDYATFEIAGENLFAIRGHDDKIRVFYNVANTALISWSAAGAPPALSFALITHGHMN